MLFGGDWCYGRLQSSLSIFIARGGDRPCLEWPLAVKRASRAEQSDPPSASHFPDIRKEPENNRKSRRLKLLQYRGRSFVVAEFWTRFSLPRTCSLREFSVFSLALKIRALSRVRVCGEFSSQGRFVVNMNVRLALPYEWIRHRWTKWCTHVANNVVLWIVPPLEEIEGKKRIRDQTVVCG